MISIKVYDIKEFFKVLNNYEGVREVMYVKWENILGKFNLYLILNDRIYVFEGDIKEESDILNKLEKEFKVVVVRARSVTW